MKALFVYMVLLAAAPEVDPPDLNTDPRASGYRLRASRMERDHNIEWAWYTTAQADDNKWAIAACWQRATNGKSPPAELCVIGWGSNLENNRLLRIEMSDETKPALEKLTRPGVSQKIKHIDDPAVPTAPAALKADLTRLGTAVAAIRKLETPDVCDRLAVVASGKLAHLLPADDRWMLLAWSSRTGRGVLVHAAQLKAGNAAPIPIAAEIPKAALTSLEAMIGKEVPTFVGFGRRGTALVLAREIRLRLGARPPHSNRSYGRTWPGRMDLFASHPSC